MILVKPSHEILFIQPDLLQLIEKAGRTCYKSEDKITDDSAEKFVKRIVKSGHHSVIEHANITVKFICDRGVTHELVRHRIASYSQESTRYCNYHDGVTFVIPPWVDIEEGEYTFISPLVSMKSRANWIWFLSMLHSERDYCDLLEQKWSPQKARTVLRPSTKTEIVMTCNVREMLHILNLRCSLKAHPQMRELMLPLLKELNDKVPAIFNDLYNKYGE